MNVSSVTMEEEMAIADLTAREIFIAPTGKYLNKKLVQTVNGCMNIYVYNQI